MIITPLNGWAEQLLAIEAGADLFLSKPIEEKILIAHVKLLVELAEHRSGHKAKHK